MNHHDSTAQDEFARLHRQLDRVEAQFRIILGSACGVIIMGVLLWAPLAMSEPDIPVTTEYPDLYHFSPNTPALAAEVNSNFATNRGLAADNAAGISDLQTKKLDKQGGTVSGNLDIDGILDVGTSVNTSLRLYNDSDITGADVIQGHNDLRLRGDGSGGDDLVIRANGDTKVSHDLEVSGTIRFQRQDCYQKNSSTFWTYCADGEFVAGIDYDHNSRGTGGVYCCKF